MTGRPYTLLYDGTCGMCSRFAEMLRGLDRRNLIEVIPSQTPGVAARFPWIPERAYAEAIQLVGPAPDDHTWQGAQAVEQLLRILPRGRWISWIFGIPFVGRLADWVYRWVAKNRYRLGCGRHCQVPNPASRV